MPFTIEDNHTVGVGIDFENEMFFVFNNNNYYEHKFKRPNKCERIYATIRGADSDSCNEYVSVNFGNTPFKYNITAFTPWEENIIKISCYISYNNQINTIPLIFILIIKS